MAIGVMIDAMEYAEERTNYSNVAAMIEFYEMSIRARGDVASINRYDALLRRIAPALEYEKTFGAGSLLNLEDPDNAALIRAGIIKHHKVEAALRHRGRTCALGFTKEASALDSVPG
ncbi:hypothetical protein SR870_06295 [Rhodopseudomonas palustris]|uniref:hypothetical protein n=1 Tax=Rhodopseudomonas palustris TaxID=1076 RepID=UPI002ACD7141|nr:hypothetical protein [Rhodopseudomonas palustris]WQH00888.1 hypothetical protein SR870_06295 [Rhodopseudomonas palustris]